MYTVGVIASWRYIYCMINISEYSIHFRKQVSNIYEILFKVIAFQTNYFDRKHRFDKLLRFLYANDIRIQLLNIHNNLATNCGYLH